MKYELTYSEQSEMFELLGKIIAVVQISKSAWLSSCRQYMSKISKLEKTKIQILVI